jgi:hypothetical protein
MRHVCLFPVTKSQNTQLSAFNHAHEGLFYEHISARHYLYICLNIESE